MITIKIPKIAPPNRVSRRPNGGFYTNFESEEYDEATRKACEGLSPPPPPYDVTVTITPYNANAFLSSRIKQTFDALTRCGFWKDDSRVRSVTLQYGRGLKTQTKIEIKEANGKTQIKEKHP